MENRQLYPLEVNTHGEPFLCLKARPNIILTPPRLTDASALMEVLNDDNVCRWLSDPPYPYLQEHADYWLSQVKLLSDKILEELDSARDEALLRIVDDCPVRYIREVREDGTDVFIGDVAIIRCTMMDLTTSSEISQEEKDRLLVENISRPAGDPKIVWTIGNYLSSSHHGRGIMTDVYATLLESWAIPRMGVRRMIGTAFEGNQGSVRVFEKNGFVMKRTIPNYKEAKGVMRSLHVLNRDFADKD
ncbi:hypothetical protein IW261DRAFT_1583758 [Armillaria novae-zelandiae]|uniref:N-acetyltransferase domain-containing protein n=1 Tax=Armillaria novae-zelandiae TaxID=153914 RepID=A0AA39PCN7_9AGAR|nr:hypothetical protein IW261DRAFT_1583758 [Armillaria novae-zelandiae]